MKLRHKINPLHKEVGAADIRAKRDSIESSPISIPLFDYGLMFHTDDLSMKRMSSQIRNMKRSGRSEIIWKLAGPDTVKLTLSAIQRVHKMIQDAVDDRVNLLHRRESDLLSRAVVTEADLQDDQWI